ncbi:uncharacterized protein LOC130358723 [Hyla sarda]|uniref:uncharacterized protein LOC130358723 n=1 Tax=Hyla sarda TaxID=327740 RepID=UPI0024C23CBD|nr:uncharacterized protein LOC130358723 [Hyla sarda]XP_056418358.1 uncharacterized protein LOC130358723 [Hyla sarda]
MNYKSRDAMWLEKAQNMFDIGSSPGTESVQKTTLKRTMRNLLQKRTRLWWNRVFLQKYLSGGLLPRGLRIQVFPSYPVEDNELKNKWEEACNKCSQTFLELLISHNNHTLDTMERELEDTQASLIKECSKMELEAFNKELDENLNIWEKDIQTMKTKKYQRDSVDAQSNRVYKWRQNQTKPLARSLSVSSLASVGAESTTSSSYRQQFSGRKRKIEHSYGGRNTFRKRNYNSRDQNQD